jgi:hypothetical protein
MRREIIHELTDGNPVEGMKKFIAYATILPLSGATVQEVKDFISRGDKISIEDMPDQIAANAIKLMGTSQWVIENRVKEGKPFSALAEAVMPPINLFDGLVQELQSIYEGEKFDPQTSQMLQRLPPYGRLVQDTLLGAREAKRIKEALADQLPGKRLSSIVGRGLFFNSSSIRNSQNCLIFRKSSTPPLSLHREMYFTIAPSQNPS